MKDFFVNVFGKTESHTLLSGFMKNEVILMHKKELFMMTVDIFLFPKKIQAVTWEPMV